MDSSFIDEMSIRQDLLGDAGIGGLSEECLTEVVSMAYFDEFYNALLEALNARNEYLYHLGATQGAQRVQVKTNGLLDGYGMGHA